MYTHTYACQSKCVHTLSRQSENEYRALVISTSKHTHTQIQRHHFGRGCTNTCRRFTLTGSRESTKKSAPSANDAATQHNRRNEHENSSRDACTVVPTVRPNAMLHAVYCRSSVTVAVNLRIGLPSTAKLAYKLAHICIPTHTHSHTHAYTEQTHKRQRTATATAAAVVPAAAAAACERFIAVCECVLYIYLIC